MHGARSSGMIIKIPMYPYSYQRLKKNAEVLEEIHAMTNVSERLIRCVPRSIARGGLLGEAYFVEELKPGVCGNRLKLSLPDRNRLIRAAVDLLTEWHQSHLKRVTVDEAVMESKFIKPFKEVCRFLNCDERSSRITRLTSVLRKMALGARMPLVWSHGDFSLKNLLVDESHLGVLGMIDWDLSARDDLPLIDLLHLLIRVKMKERRMAFHDVLCNCLFPVNLEAGEKRTVAEYADALSVDASLITPLSIMYWISRLHGHIGSSKNLDTAWVNDNFIRVARHLERNLPT